MCKPVNSLFIFSLLILFSISCSDRKTPLFKKDNTNLAERKNTLFVFVGEKVEVKELSQEEGSMDGRYYGKYKVLQSVYGNYTSDIIEFTAYDHYGEPAFSKYKNVLLFVSEYKGKYYHEKYLFNDVYKTKDNKWAGVYSVRDFGYDNNRKGMSAQKIDFAQEVSFPLSLVSNKKETGCWFPEPYYRIENDRAVAVYGSNIEDLFKIKKDGVLTARRLFGDGKPDEFDVINTEVAEVLDVSDDDWENFQNFWNEMLKEKTYINKIFAHPLDTISINDTFYSAKNAYVKKFFKKQMQLLKTNGRLDYNPANLPEKIKEKPYLKNQLAKASGIRPFFQVEAVIDTIKTTEVKTVASFIKTKDGFKLYGMKEERKFICWQ